MLMSHRWLHQQQHQQQRATAELLLAMQHLQLPALQHLQLPAFQHLQSSAMQHLQLLATAPWAVLEAAHLQVPLLQTAGAALLTPGLR
jgi:hypothetical protein